MGLYYHLVDQQPHWLPTVHEPRLLLIAHQFIHSFRLLDRFQSIAAIARIQLHSAESIWLEPQFMQLLFVLCACVYCRRRTWAPPPPTMGKNPFERPWMVNNGAAAAAGGGGAIGLKGIIAGGITGHWDLHHLPHRVREDAAAVGRERWATIGFLLWWWS